MDDVDFDTYYYDDNDDDEDEPKMIIMIKHEPSSSHQPLKNITRSDHYILLSHYGGTNACGVCILLIY